MEEKRRCKRTKVHLELNVTNLFKQDNVNIVNVNSPIVVTDVSKTGIGFISGSILPLNYYFNASLQIGSEKNVLYTVVRIVRCEPLENGEYSYGCEFVGMAPILDYIFDEIEEAEK